jgi:signal peptidase I
MRRLRPLLFTLALALGVLGATAAFGALAGYRIARVQGDEMSPSLSHGDWLLLGPGDPRRGDVVRLVDPLDPERRILRRVLAEPGERIGFAGHQPRLDDLAMKHAVMGDRDGEMVLMEAQAWLLAVSLESTRQRIDPSPCPEGQRYLVADHRDVALDSRHWGAIPLAELELVHLRLGASDVWRSWVFRPRQTVRPEIPQLPYQIPEDLKGQLPSPR